MANIGSGPVEFHVNGLAKIYVVNTLSYLGYSSEQGVTIEFDPKFEPIYTDAYGGQVPEDIQNMGMLATITFELLKWDQTILSLLQTHSLEATGSAGAPLGPSPNADGSGNILVGKLLKQCSWTFPMWIDRSTSNVGCETNVEGAYEFYTCYVGPDAFSIGTKATRHRLTIHALPNASGALFGIVPAF